MKYKEKIIGFVDVLGWKNLVARSENKNDVTLDDLLAYTKAFTTSKTRGTNYTFEHTICPNSGKISKDLDFQKTQVSDCAILSCEKSPAGVIALISECHGMVYNLLCHGIMCRGYIVVGNIFHETGNKIIGTGYQYAMEMESKMGLPFVGIDPKVDEFISSHTDQCVQKIYSKLVLRGKDFTALFPFNELTDSFIIGSFMGIPLNIKEQRASNQRNKILIQKIIKLLGEHTDHKNEKALKKTKVYILELIEQLIGCHEAGDLLDQLEEELS
tara:strand:+ start:1330 stop:2142 length:813 start_codon:yes stop_codon:yes gene_type:complete